MGIDKAWLPYYAAPGKMAIKLQRELHGRADALPRENRQLAGGH